VLKELSGREFTILLQITAEMNELKMQTDYNMKNYANPI
jgi:hypothetical protein